MLLAKPTNLLMTTNTIVNYCDFTCYWSFEDFKKYCTDNSLDGAILQRFHPHSYGTTNYAYIKEQNLLLEAIQEKQPFTSNRVDEFASSGTTISDLGVV